MAVANRPRLADISLAVAGAMLMGAAFLPWTGGYDGALSGWDLTSHFGLLWDLANEGSSDAVWVDSGLAITTGAATIGVGAIVLTIAACHLRPRSVPASAEPGMWFAGIGTLAVGLNPWVVLSTPPPADARIGALVGAVAGAAVPTILVVDVIARGIRQRGSERVQSVTRWCVGIGLLGIAALATLPALDPLTEDRPIGYRLEEAAAWAMLSLIVGTVGVILVARNRGAT